MHASAADGGAGRESIGLSLIRVTVGALWVTQFFANIHDGHFTVAGYRRLVTGYVERADSPSWWKSFEGFAVDHAGLFLLLQATGEICIGVALIVGIARPIAGLGSAALLTLLWVSELGLYWTWELVPVIAASLAIAVDARGDAARPRRLLLGPRPLFSPWTGRLVPFAGAAAVAFVVLANRDPTVEAWRAATVVGAGLVASAIIDARARSAG